MKDKIINEISGVIQKRACGEIGPDTYSSAMQSLILLYSLECGISKDSAVEIVSQACKLFKWPFK
jgi:hypothetical protein